MSFPHLSRATQKDSYVFGSSIVVQKVINFNPSLFYTVLTLKCCLKYILFKFQFTLVLLQVMIL